MRDAVITIDADSTILSANEAVDGLFGWAPAELIGKPLTLIMPEHDRGRARPGTELEVTGLHRGGGTLPLELSFAESRLSSTYVALLRRAPEHAVTRALDALSASLELMVCELWLAGDGRELTPAARVASADPRAMRVARQHGRAIAAAALASGAPGAHGALHPDLIAVGLGGALAYPVPAGLGAIVGFAAELPDPRPAAPAELLDEIARGVAEQARRRDEGRLSLLARQLPGLVYTLDRALAVTATAGRLPGRLDVAAAALIAGVRSLNERALAGEGASGTIPWGDQHLDVRAEPLFDDRGVAGVVGTVLDATERVRTEATLRAIAWAIGAATGDAFLRALVEYLARELGVSCAMVSERLPGDRRKSGFTGQEDAQAGFSPGGLRTRTLSVWLEGRLHEPIEHEVVGSACDLVWTRGSCCVPEGAEKEFPGDSLLVDLGMTSYAGTLAVDGDGQPLGCLCVLGREPFRDPETVTSILRVFAARVAAEIERTRADEALRESEQRYRALFEHSPNAMFLIDPESERVLCANQAALDVYGFLPHQLFAMRLGDLRVESDGAIVRHRRRGGDLIDVELSAHETRSGGRRVRCVVARDVTHKRLLARELGQAQKLEAVGRLAGGVAHDFNNLLTAILTISELALQAAPPAVADDLRQIQEAAMRGAKLTRQLLAFSRKQMLRPAHVDLNSVVAELGTTLGRIVGDDVELVRDLAPGLGSTRVDASQMEQVLVNLALNAREAMPRGGQLSITTRNVTSAGGPGAPPAGEHVRLTVADTGRGMPPEVLARVFEPFFSTKGSGHGLGLATVYGIVQQSDGRIFVRSEPGKGTAFDIFLPRVAGRAPARASDAPTGTEIVLLVEDDAAVRRAARRILHDCGYHVLEAGDAHEALRLCREREGRIDLLLTDVVMPLMGGRELAEQVVPLCPGVRVLYMSGYTDDAIVRQGVHHGVAAFLEKPFSAEAMARKVREVLDRER